MSFGLTFDHWDGGAIGAARAFGRVHSRRELLGEDATDNASESG